MPDARNIGLRGEELAVRYLEGAGFRILARNWRSGRYELDIVAERDGVLHVVEVKTRRAGGLTAPEDALTPAKFRALCRAASLYIERYGLDMEVVFDLVAVDDYPDGARVRFIPSAVSPSW